MKLVLIYGPPAVGKLTVAQALADLTGFKLFHNHLSIDWVTAIFERGTPPYYRMVRGIRAMLFEEAAKAKLDGLIFTIVFDTPRKTIIDHYVEIVERHHGQACLVQLYCQPDILAERVQSGERQTYGKITDAALLKQVLGQLQDPFSLVPGYESLSLDTGLLSPHAAAQKIAAHFLS